MNQIENKPWGSYEVLLDEPNYKVKRIVVDAYQRFSLQYHKHRFDNIYIFFYITLDALHPKKFLLLRPHGVC